MENANYLKGILSLLENKYEKTIEIFKSALKTKDLTTSDYILLGSVLRKNKEVNKAIYIHESLVDKKHLDKSLSYILYFELLKDYYEAKEYSKALFYANKLLEFNKSADIFKYIYKIKVKLEECDEAIKYIKLYEKLSKKVLAKEISHIYMLKYKKLLAEGKKEEGLIKKALSKDPTNRQANFNVYKSVLSSNRKNQIIEMINTLLQKDVIKTFDDIKMLESDLFPLELFNDFEKIILKAVAQNHKNPIYHIYASKILSKRGEIDKAKDILFNYLQNINKLEIVKNSYIDLTLDSEIKEDFKNSNIYICKNCQSSFANYMDECTNCEGIETLDFA